ncbi:hypothetical protein SEUCBS139899_006163 [Sporothrix eucalyptigena]|uniref:Major facilitator superfamily (MFS) profile domain-containing protein n=1 Tax=Sporothrix eucalyptigena TaxID=1812306 RepID=A0ABP0AQM8_9PEZI
MAKLTALNLASVLFAASGGFTYGFGFGVFTSSIGQPGFFSYFDLVKGSTYEANIIDAINSLFAFGAALGALTQGYTSDWLGRRRAIFAAAILCIIGGALTAGSAAIPMLIVVRFIQGIGLGQCVTLAPLYISEVAPARIRGLLIGVFSAALGTGYTVVAWISFGTHYATNETVQWRVPLALACVAPLAQAIGVWFIPESPRWLVLKDRKEDAWQIVHRLHHDPNDTEERNAQAEFTQICRQVAFDKQFDVSYIQMFRRGSWRKRSLLVLFLMFASQSTGVLGIGNYAILIYESLGFTGGLPIMMNAVYTLIGTSCTFLGSYLADRVGRRTLLVIGFPINCLFLLGEAMLQRQYVDSTSHAGLSACVLFLFLYIVSYDICIDPVSFIYVAEIWPTAIRSKGIALGWFAYFMGTLTYTTPAALAFKNIGWRYYMVFFGCNIVSSIVIYFFLPETKGKTLEEMGDLFGDEVVVHMADDGRGFVETGGDLMESKVGADGGMVQDVSEVERV